MRTPLLTTGSVAKMLGLTSAGVIWLASTGKLHSERTESGQRLYRLADVEALAEKRRRAAEGRRVHPMVGPYDHPAR